MKCAAVLLDLACALRWPCGIGPPGHHHAIRPAPAAHAGGGGVALPFFSPRALAAPVPTAPSRVPCAVWRPCRPRGTTVAQAVRVQGRSARVRIPPPGTCAHSPSQPVGSHPPHAACGGCVGRARRRLPAFFCRPRCWPPSSRAAALCLASIARHAHRTASCLCSKVQPAPPAPPPVSLDSLCGRLFSHLPPYFNP